MTKLLLQVEAIKKIAEYVAQLRMVGKGHGMIQISEIDYHCQVVAVVLTFTATFWAQVFVNWWLAGVWHFDQMLLHEGDAAL